MRKKGGCDGQTDKSTIFDMRLSGEMLAYLLVLWLRKLLYFTAFNIL